MEDVLNEALQGMQESFAEADSSLKETDTKEVQQEADPAPEKAEEQDAAGQEPKAQKEEVQEAEQPTVQPEAKQPEAQPEDFDAVARKKGYVSKDELEAFKKEYDVDSDAIKKLIQLHKDGHAITHDLLAKTLIDYDKYNANEQESALMLIRMDVKNEHPEWDAERIDAHIKRKYRPLYKYEKGDEEYEDAFQDLYSDALDARGRLKEQQSKLGIPADNPQAKVDSRQELENKFKESWKETAKQGVKDVKSVKVSEELAYTLSADEVRDITSTIRDKVSVEGDFMYSARYYNKENKTWDFQRMVEDAAWNNGAIRAKMLQKQASEAAAKAKAETLNIVENADPTVSKSGGGGKNPEAELTELFSSLSTVKR